MIQKILKAIFALFFQSSQKKEPAAPTPAGPSTKRSVSPARKRPIATPAVADRLLHEAHSHMGIPHAMGGTSPSGGFDCSGFIQYVFDKQGLSIPRTSRAQAQTGESISLDEARKGDLVFFSQNQDRISHVGIVISSKGEDLSMIHASNSKGISTINIDRSSYWKPRLMFAKRVV